MTTNLTLFLGLSGYSTPVSKEGSPRNSAFLDTFQPTMLSQVTVGNLFEGKAISEIFRLVEEERKTLEASLASATKVGFAPITSYHHMNNLSVLHRASIAQW